MAMNGSMAGQIGGQIQGQIAQYITPILTTRDRLKYIGKAEGDYNTNMDKAAAFQSPYQNAGSQGLQSIGDMMKSGAYNAPKYQTAKPFQYGADEMKNDPAYQFQQQEGQKAVQASAAARGQALSGATMRALARYGTNLANQSFQQNRQFGYNKYLNDLSQYNTEYNQDVAAKQGQYNRDFQMGSTMAGYGQNAANNLSNMWANRAEQSAQFQLDRGNAVAGGHAEAGQAVYNQGQDVSAFFGSQGGGGGQGGGGSQSSIGTSQQYSQPIQQNFQQSQSAPGYSADSGGTGINGSSMDWAKSWYAQ